MAFLRGILILCMLPLATGAQIKHGLRDKQGRHIVARGFVVITEDAAGDVCYNADDYARMVRLGANYQVIRLALGRLSAFPGSRLDPAYLERLDNMVALGRNAGLKTIFKMTTYRTRGFTWEAFWTNENNAFDLYLDAWRVIWSRYQNDPSVVGYDLINEPRKLMMEITYDDLTSQFLLPYYRRLIDAKNQYNPNKVAICQAIFMNKGEAINGSQYAEIKEPINRPNVYFSPHVYLGEIEQIEPVMARLEKEADLWGAPMFIGEWGMPTYESTDISIDEQFEFARLYQETATCFDRTGVGTIKAWFTGTRTMQDFLPRGRSTWSIFSDKAAVGTAERKYITDIIARPYPQAIAGDIFSFAFNFATRELTVEIATDNAKGASRIFVGADRHYPDGFSLFVGDALILAHNPLDAGPLTAVQNLTGHSPQDFIWDPATQQLTILRWPRDRARVTLRIAPRHSQTRQRLAANALIRLLHRFAAGIFLPDGAFVATSPRVSCHRVSP